MGGAVGGALWVAYDAPFIGFPIMGVAGGAALGVARGNRGRVWPLALAGAIGYGLGFLVAFFVPLALWEPASPGLFVGAVGGAIGGASLGATMKGWKGAGLLAVASAIGFGLAAWATWEGLRGQTPQVLFGALSLAAWGAAGGICVGLVLAWLERK